MKKTIVFLILTSILSTAKVFGQTDTIPKDFCISSEEYQLYQLINDYRKAFALPPIALSKSLSYVAIAHVRDLSANYKPDSNCNMHSWSAKGRWKPICFPTDQSKKNNVWLKAKEIIGYPSEARELTYWSNVENTPQQILSFWRKNKASSEMILNLGKWESSPWKAVGVGIQDGYAVLWFGKEIDIEVTTAVCGSTIKVINDASPEYQAAPIQKPDTKALTYYITVASFNNHKDAANAVKSYKEMGYPKAVLIEKDDKIRLAIDHFLSKEEAETALVKYAKKFKGAWILAL
ncbi:MAG: SPOR domain-containing protein [Bacteroidales bacterium]|nr:SPOR domain-containing protein [Bacteroidales bacterium]